MDVKKERAIQKMHQRSVPTPSVFDEYEWQRRYSWLIQERLAFGGKRPSEAATEARQIIIEEFKEECPDQDPYDWMKTQ